MSLEKELETPNIKEEIDNEDENIILSNILSLGLGDIINLQASTNDEINNKIFYIVYIDNTKLKLINDNQNITLSINEYGELDEKSIESIEILSKASEKGYAKQNNLNINTWISIQFDGDLPITINGIITDSENDLIEIKTYPDEEYIYIDFAYKGIPEDLPIKNIKIIDNPLEKKEEKLKYSEDDDDENLLDYVEINKDELDKTLIANTIPNDFIEFGEELDDIILMVDVDESKRRYDIEQQLNDLLDEMLSTVKNSNRSSIVLNNIHNQINRFNQLRELYSDKDNGNNYNLKERIDANYKPAVDEIIKFNKNIKWITPVLTNKKILYDIENNRLDDDNEKFESIMDSLNRYNESYNEIKSNSNVESINKYRLILQNINDFNKTFINDSDNYFYKSKTKNYMNFLVNNYDFVMSNVVKTNDKSTELTGYSFYNQVLNSPDTNLERIIENNKKKNKRVYHTYDEFLLNSFIINNELLYKYSNVNLPNTNIYQKCSDSLNYKYFISNNYYYKNNFTQEFLDNFKTSRQDKDLLKNNIYYILNTELYKENLTEEYGNKENKENKENLIDLLKSILPSTGNLIDKFKLSKLNISQFLYDLQPNFTNIYNIEFELYTKIISYIKENIEIYKKQLIANKELFENLINKKNKEIINKAKLKKMKIFTIFKKLETVIRENFFDKYNINSFKINETEETNNKYLYTDEEIYNHTNNIDNNRTFFYSFYQTLLELITSNQIEQFLDIKNKNIEEIRKDANNMCNKFILSKKYLELDELESDNNKLIYFDKKLDRTNYKLLDKLKEQQKLMNKDDFRILLKNKLLEDEIVNNDNIEREIDSILKQKKEIIDGDYAILINSMQGRRADLEKDVYKDDVYVRENNRWIIDKNVEPSMFFMSNKLFCNLQEKCVESNDKCNTFDELNSSFENETIDNIVEQSSLEFKRTMDETKDIIKKNLINSLIFLERKNQYDKINKLKYNELLQKIGLSYVENTLQLSPYENLKNKILNYNDFVKKQNFIIKFAQLYTREAINDEDKNWLYCNKTNNKLLPSFLRELAISYMNGNYLYTLDKIISDRGTISDDGNNWVDKYSGYTIKIIEFDTDEGYNEEGFKMQSRDILEKDYAITETNIKYTSETSKIIYKIIISISSFIGLKLEPFYDFIINNVMELLKITIPSKENYEKTQRKNKEMGKKDIVDYDTLYNSTLIISSMCFILISIQTSIPSLKTKKTFPGCIKSFTGYPMLGNVDKSSITYIACVVNKIKTNVAPWNSILKTSEKSLIKKMELIIENNILKNPKIIDLFNKKLEYLKVNKDDIIPDELDINRWITYLPPLYDIKLSDEKLQPVSNDFKKIIIDKIKKKQSNNYYYDMLLKINTFSFAIISSIQKIVKKNSTLLSTNNGEPFLENACCNNILNSIKYFINEDNDIKLYNDNAKLLTDFLKDINLLEKASLLYHPFNTRIGSYELPNMFSEETIYLYFIKYCKFDTILPVSEEVRAICMNKPSDYNSDDILEKKIQILKNNGNNYSISSLDELMQIFNLENTFKIDKKENIDSIQKLHNTLKSILELIENDIAIEKLFNKKIIEKLIEVISKSPGVVANEITDENNDVLVRELKNLLMRDTDINKNKVFEYLKANANINTKDLNNFKKCFDNFFIFQDINFQNIQQFFKNSIRNIIRVFPNIIIHNNNIQESNFIPSYWKLSSKHNEDLYTITNNYYKSLFSYFDSKKIDIILKSFQDRCILIEQLIKYTNFYEPIKFEKSSLTIFTIFDEKLTLLLFENYLYRILVYLTELHNDPSIILQLNEIDNDESLLDKDDESEKTDFDIEGTISKGEINDIDTGNISYTSFVEKEKEVIENNSANIIYSFINILCDSKKMVDINYENISKKITYAKDKEKKSIVNFLKEMSAEEREVENILKNNKLERWSVGLQKGLVEYDPLFYDKEREKLENQLLKEVKMQNIDEVSKMNAEIYSYDLEYQEQLDKDVDNEYSINNIPDDNDYDDVLDDFEYSNYDGDE